MTKKQIAKNAAREMANRVAHGEVPVNAFLSVRPRGSDTPTHKAPAKRGPKTTSGTGLVLNIKGQRQAPLQGRATPAHAIIPRQSWADTNDKIRRITHAKI